MRMHCGWGMIVALLLILPGCCCPFTCSPMSCVPAGCCPQPCLTESIQDHYYEVEDWMLTQGCRLNRTMACQMHKLSHCLTPTCYGPEGIEPYDVTTSAKVRPASQTGARGDRRTARRCKRCKQSPCRCGHCEDCEGFEPVEQPGTEHFEEFQAPVQDAPYDGEIVPGFQEPEPLPPAPSSGPTPIYKSAPLPAPMKSTSTRNSGIRLSATAESSQAPTGPLPDEVAPTSQRQPAASNSPTSTTPNDGWRPVSHAEKLARLAR